MIKYKAMSSELVVQYLLGAQVYVKYPSIKEWIKVAPYKAPDDIYRLSCKAYKFGIKEADKVIHYDSN